MCREAFKKNPWYNFSQRHRRIVILSFGLRKAYEFICCKQTRETFFARPQIVRFLCSECQWRINSQKGKAAPGTNPGNSSPKSIMASNIDSIGSSMQGVREPIVYQQGPAKVTELHYELPKGKHSNLVGSFSYRTVSPKAGQLKGRIAMEEKKLRDQTIKDRKKGKISHKKRAKIRCKIKYLQGQLCHEINSSPITRVCVHERDDDKSTATSSSSDAAYEVMLSK